MREIVARDRTKTLKRLNAWWNAEMNLSQDILEEVIKTQSAPRAADPSPFGYPSAEPVLIDGKALAFAPACL